MRSTCLALVRALLWAAIALVPALAGAQAPPTDVRAFPGDANAMVRFTQPSPGASPIVSFTATSSPGGITATAASNETRARVTGLANGTAYTFTVTTEHADGSSETSIASNSVTPARLPHRLAPWAYVPSEDGFVTVIDTATDQVINTIDVGALCAGVAANPAGTRVYVANVDSVSVIDTALQAVVATIPIADGPFAIAVKPDGTRVYTANLGSPSFTAIDADTNTVITTTPLPGPPLGMDVDRTGSSVYVGFPLDRTIVRIDTATNTIAETSAPLDVAPAGIEAATSDLVYVADLFGGQVATLSGVTEQSVTTLPDVEAGAGIVMDPANHDVYFTRDPGTSAGTVNLLGTAGTGTVGMEPVGIAVTPASKVYIANHGDDTVSVVLPSHGIGLFSFTPIATIPVGHNPIALGRFIAIADPSPPRLGNISTRTQVLTGDNVMIAGFIVGGPGSKTVAVTATGPSLRAFGITNQLENPRLTIVRASDQSIVASNDDWQTDPNAAQLLASGFAPASSLEAGLYLTLPPGAYTAIVQGADGGTGVSVVGVFEVDHPEIPLANISTRGYVQTGGDVMIGGFIVNGSGPQSVVISATGPSLATFGITNPLANPQLTLVRSSDQSVVATNDDWQGAPNASAIAASGFAPADPHEAAILVTLDPGAYTAIVQGAGGTTGVAVVGVFTTP